MFTNKSREFLKDFKALCEQALIDHCTTSHDHPKLDGLVERVV
jgi:hypothetical protein